MSKKKQTIADLEHAAATARREAERADDALRVAKAAMAHEREEEAFRNYLQRSRYYDKQYRDSIAFHYDVRFSTLHHLGFDGYAPAVRQSDQAKTIAVLAQWITELTGEAWDRK